MTIFAFEIGLRPRAKALILEFLARKVSASTTPNMHLTRYVRCPGLPTAHGADPL